MLRKKLGLRHVEAVQLMRLAVDVELETVAT